MNCEYYKCDLLHIYYKIIDDKQILTIRNYKYDFRYILSDDARTIVLTKIDPCLNKITKEEFDIVINDAILKMIEISIL